MEDKICKRGINFFSDIKINEQNLNFIHKNKQIFTLPSESIKNTNIINKEIILEMKETEKKGMILKEIRLIKKNDDKNVQLKNLDKKIKKILKIDEKVENKICLFPKLSFLVPRNNFDVIFFKNFLLLQGLSYNTKIFHKNIKKIFLLTMPDKVHIQFLINLSKPLRKGQTIYKNIIIKLKINKKIELQIEKQIPNLENYIEGQEFTILSKLIKNIIKTNIIIPGNFKSSLNNSSIKCSIGAKSGNLFFLSKSLIFIPQPIKVLKLKNVALVEFFRIGELGVNRNFDVKLILENKMQIIFSGIEKCESDGILGFFKKSGVNCKIVKENDCELENNSYESDFVSQDEKIHGKIEEEDDEDDSNFEII